MVIVQYAVVEICFGKPISIGLTNYNVIFIYRGIEQCLSKKRGGVKKKSSKIKECRQTYSLKVPKLLV